MKAPVEVIAERIPAAAGSIEPIDEHSCVFETGSDSTETPTLWLGMLGADFTVTGSPELIEHFRTLSERYSRAATPPAH